MHAVADDAPVPLLALDDDVGMLIEAGAAPRLFGEGAVALVGQRSAVRS